MSAKHLDWMNLSTLRTISDLIVIAFWVSLVAFVVLLFLILLYMPWSGSLQLRNHPQHHPACPWSHILNLPLCFRRRLARPGGPPGASQAPSPLGEPGSRGSAPDGQLEREGPPAPLRPTLLSSGNWSTLGPPMVSADSRNQPGSLPQTEPLNCRIDTTMSQPGLRGPVNSKQAGHTLVLSKPVYV
nr:melanocortin-2 receptor accessory protein isoform X2 [Dasypus novemcinctus]